jgi:hypothetical protein
MVFNDERVPRWVILYRLGGLSLKAAGDITLEDTL